MPPTIAACTIHRTGITQMVTTEAEGGNASPVLPRVHRGIAAFAILSRSWSCWSYEGLEGQLLLRRIPVLSATDVGVELHGGVVELLLRQNARLHGMAVPPETPHPDDAMLALRATGTTCDAKLRKVASKGFRGICTVSKRNPRAIVARWMLGFL